MKSLKLLNSSQPQTLMIASILLYVNAVLQLISFLLYSGTSPLLPLFGIILPAIGGWGVANEKRWGYYVALVAAGVPILLILYYVSLIGVGFITSSALQVIFAIVPLVLLLHNQSRAYVKTWFV